MQELPTTAIGLIAFILVGAGYTIRYLSIQNKETIDTFMSYIQTKNANLERTSKEFSERMDAVIERHQDAMKELIDNHKNNGYARQD